MALTIHLPQQKDERIEVVTPFDERVITHAFHDIDGTHSRIRDWVPVMSLVTGATARYGMFQGTPAEIAASIREHKDEIFEEAHRFSIESAGLSALTQMEWALRMSRRLDHESSPVNEKIIEKIWQGEERFGDAGESAELLQKTAESASRLFKAYEILLLEMGRNENLQKAALDPEPWRLPGSMDFLRKLQEHGIQNYFVTGAVVEHDPNGNPLGTMYEEICALQYPVGKGKLIEEFRGSSWHEKQPKVEIMKEICREKRIDPAHVLIVGDGRSEIAAGVELGAVTISRLDRDAVRAREIHKQLGTNMIIEDYRDLFSVFFTES